MVGYPTGHTGRLYFPISLTFGWNGGMWVLVRPCCIFHYPLCPLSLLPACLKVKDSKMVGSFSGRSPWIITWRRASQSISDGLGAVNKALIVLCGCDLGISCFSSEPVLSKELSIICWEAKCQFQRKAYACGWVQQHHIILSWVAFWKEFEDCVILCICVQIQSSCGYITLYQSFGFPSIILPIF